MCRISLATLVIGVAACGGAIADPLSQAPDAGSQAGVGGGSSAASGSGTGNGSGTGTGSGTGGGCGAACTGNVDDASAPEATVDSGPRAPDAPPPPPAIYGLQLVARYRVPVSNAVGVACDGAHVWLMAGDHNAPSHTLSYVELATGVVSKSFKYDNLIEQLGTGVYGITQLGGTVFISVAGNTNKIVLVDATSGKITGQFSAPTDLGPSDLDVSDGRLVESSGTGDVFILDVQSGAVQADFTAGDFGRDHGVAVRGNEAFVGSLFGGLDVYDLTTGSSKGHVTKQDGSEFAERDIGSMCFNGTKLLVLGQLGLSEYEVRAP